MCHLYIAQSASVMYCKYYLLITQGTPQTILILMDPYILVDD